MDLESGDVIGGRYVVERELGRGGSATVYLATDVDGRVAVKVLNRPPGGYDAATAARAEREVAHLRDLRSPHLVRLLDAGTTAAGLMFLVYEYVSGADLADVLEERGTFSPDDVSDILRQLLTGLGHAHRKGLIHRDIKPQNIRVQAGTTLTVKLIDFGIARAPDAYNAPRITATNEIVGTPRYMSPEQLTNRPLTPASDIYSLGIVALELLQGPGALHGHRLGDQLDRLRSGHLFAAEESSTHPLWAVIRRMAATNVEERFPSCEAVLSALDAEPRRQTTRRATRPRRHLRKLVAIALAAIAVVVALTALLVGSLDDPPPPHTAVVRATKHEVAIVRAEIDLGPPQVAQVGEVPKVDVGVDDAGAPAPRAPAIRSPGCGNAPPGVRSDRSYAVPEDYDSNVAHPLLLFFHDDVVPPHNVLTPDVLHLLDSERVILVAPHSQRPRQLLWADEFRRAWRDRAKARRVALDTRRWALDNFCVDERRVFVIAHGMGGFGANRIACQPWVTAVGYFGTPAVPGGYRVPRCKQVTPPMVWLAPTESPAIPSEGRSGCRNRDTLDPEATREMLGRRHRCTPGTWKTTYHDGAECSEAKCEASRLLFCRTAGGAIWPGLSQTPTQLATHGLDCQNDPPSEYDVIGEMWRFFSTVDPL